MPSEQPAPPLEPVTWKILDQIGEQGRTGATVKEHNLGERKASAQDDLIDVNRPFGLGSIAELGIKAKVFALAPQPWRSVEARRWIGGLPLAKKQVMQGIGRDKVAYLAEGVD
jgi:hypothetical protein